MWPNDWYGDEAGEFQKQLNRLEQRRQQAEQRQDSIHRWYQESLEQQTLPSPPPELPDDFTLWVEEVRRQNRIEELLGVLVDKCVKYFSGHAAL